MIKGISTLGVKFAELFAQEILEDNEGFAYTMRYVLDPNMAFYKHFGLFNVHTNYLVSP